MDAEEIRICDVGETCVMKMSHGIAPKYKFRTLPLVVANLLVVYQ
jgi:hypothetical protein